MKIGYARVSTKEQNIDLQLSALKDIGCEKIFCEVISGAKTERPKLEEALSFMREGDILVIWKLDRLGRSLKHLIKTINQLSERNIGFESIQDNFNTTTSGGKLLFHIMGAIAEFERDLIRERTIAGLKAARARGKNGGRPKKLDSQKIAMAKTLLSDPNNKVKDVCKILNVSKATLYRYISE